MRHDTVESQSQARARADMVERQIFCRGIRDPAVLKAMGTVPREFFVPDENSALAYQDGPASNNVAFPSRPVLDTRASVRLLRTKIQATSHQWVLTDRLFRVAHQRGIVVQGPQHRLTVADSFVGRGTYLQKFHLAPGWTLSALTGGGRTARFTGPEGRRLTMTTTGSIRRARGATSPVAGWHFPRFGQRVATEELTVVAGPRVTTTFTLS